MKKIIMKSVVALGLFLGCCGMSNAAVIISETHPGAVNMEPTNWSHIITIPKFDPAKGDLQSILIDLTATVEGSAGFESRDSSPSEVTLELIAIATLENPAGDILVTTAPSDAETAPATAYDQDLDFDGTSGKTFINMSDTETQSALVIDMVPFIGTGTIDLTAKAKGASNAYGSGNLVLFFNTQASAAVDVTYNYIVPEPATIALMGLGSFVFARKRRN